MGVRNKEWGGHGHAWKVQGAGGVSLGSRIKATWPCVTGNLSCFHPPYYKSAGGTMTKHGWVQCVG